MLAFLAAWLLGAPPPPATGPHVLFLIADDLNCRLGCYGDPAARTPALDRLAASAIRFDRAYCQHPLCNPSRSSLLTGRLPPVTGVAENGGNFRDALPEAPTLPGWFRAQGYETVHLGKIFHDGFEDEASFDRLDERYVRFQAMPEAEKAQNRERNRLRSDEERVRRELALDEQTAALAAKELALARERPLFLCVGFRRPHVPLIAPAEIRRQFPPEGMPLPPTFLPLPRPDPSIPRFAVSLYRDIFLDRAASPADARKVIADYYATVAFLDGLVGRVLEALERGPLSRNTLVVFTSDHGWLLGENGRWGKLSLREEALRVPLLLRPPGRAAAAGPAVCPRTVELLDLFPTLCDLCGVPAPRKLDGVSVKPLLENPDARRDRPAVSFCFGRQEPSLRTERYRLNVYGEGKNRSRELFDYVVDPGETRNLAADPRYAAVLSELEDLLEERLAGVGHSSPSSSRQQRSSNSSRSSSLYPK